MRFTVREVLLVTVCVALILAYVRSRPMVWSTCCETRTVDGGEVITVFVHSQFLYKDHHVEHKSAGGGWQSIAVLKSGEESGANIVVSEGAFIDGIARIEISCNGRTLVASSRDRVTTTRPCLFRAANVSNLNYGRTLLEISWTDPAGKKQDHQFRINKGK